MTRATLPNRRRQTSFDIEHAGQHFVASVGLYDDGRVGEVFLTSRKPGSAIEAIARDAAILVSLAVQHGAPIETMRHAITRGHDGTAATVIGAALDAISDLTDEDEENANG